MSIWICNKNGNVRCDTPDPDFNPSEVNAKEGATAGFIENEATWNDFVRLIPRNSKDAKGFLVGIRGVTSLKTRPASEFREYTFMDAQNFIPKSF